MSYVVAEPTNCKYCQSPNIMRDLKSLDSARMILGGFLIHYNYIRPHTTLSSKNNDVTPAMKANIAFPYKNWESLIRHNEEAKLAASKVDFNVPALPVVKPTRLQLKRMNDREADRLKLQAKRLGIPYKRSPTGRPIGRPRKQQTDTQSLRVTITGKQG